METLVNELAVNPCGVPPLPSTVEMVMPVANLAQACRKEFWAWSESGILTIV